MNKRIICSIIIIVVVVLSSYTIYYHYHVQKVVSLYEACKEKCNDFGTNVNKKYQECLTLQVECDNFECLPNESPPNCFMRRRDICRPVSICWQRHESLNDQFKSCETECVRLVSILKK